MRELEQENQRLEAFVVETRKKVEAAQLEVADMEEALKESVETAANRILIDIVASQGVQPVPCTIDEDTPWGREGKMTPDNYKKGWKQQFATERKIK